MAGRAILGISAYYHESAAAVILDGKIVAAASEERFTRRKFDASFPVSAIRYVLAEAGIDSQELSAVAFYEKPLLKFDRLIETYHAFAPRGIVGFSRVMPHWIREKLVTRPRLRKSMADAHLPIDPINIFFVDHHRSHAASAFYPSPFETAAILVVDGVGEWASITIGRGVGSHVELLRDQKFPHSLGLFYSACTRFCGFRPDADESKLMGLSAFGHADRAAKIHALLSAEIVDVKADGSIGLNVDYFDLTGSGNSRVDAEWERLLGFPRRTGPLTQEHADLARAAQSILEGSLLKLAQTARELTGESKLVLAGGVALNCAANGAILRSNIFDDVWVQPAAGDAGGALGAALALEYERSGSERAVLPDDSMSSSLLGPSYDDASIRAALDSGGFSYRELTPERRHTEIAKLLASGAIVGHFADRMEWGPRALGSRSILADPRDKDVARRLNELVKHREDFRPFAPVVLEDDAAQYFAGARSSPYMLFTFPLDHEHRSPDTGSASLAHPYDKGSAFPAVMHVDNTARIQTVSASRHPALAAILEAFKRETGCGMLLNTSLNGPDEPIVCTPEDACRFLKAHPIEYCVIGNLLVDGRLRTSV